MGGWGVGWEAVVLALLLGLGVQGELQGTEGVQVEQKQGEKKEQGRQCNHRHARDDEVRGMSEDVFSARS